MSRNAVRLYPGPRFGNGSLHCFLFGAAFFFVAPLSLAAAPSKQNNRLPLSRIQIDGNNAVSSRDLSNLLRLKTGRPYRESQFQAAFARLQNGYLDRGFLEVVLSTEVT